MDSQIFANSLVTLKGTDLRMIYALFCRTNIGDLLLSKTKDIFSKDDSDHFTKHLEMEVKKLENETDSKIQVDLFLEMTKLLKLRGTKYSLVREIEDQCGKIVDGVYAQLQNDDKKFRVFTERQAYSSKLQQMVQYQMSKVFSELDDSFQDFSIQDQTKFAAQVNEYIHSLPEEKQNKIKDKLGINDLTVEVVRKAIATSGTSIVFAIIVEVSGFAFYTTATSIVASFAGLMGLTLPFGFYTGLTSTIAVLANPIFIIPLLLGGGALLVNHQNKSLRKKLLPIIVMQIALPFMSGGSETIEFDSFIEEWEKRYEKNDKLHKQMQQIEVQQNETRKHMIEKIHLISTYNDRIIKHEQQIQSKKQEIKSDLKYIEPDKLDVGESFQKHAIACLRIKKDIESLKQAKKERSAGKNGMLKWIGNSFSNLSSSIEIHTKENEFDNILDKMVEDILYAQGSYKQNECYSVNTWKDNIKQLKTNKKEEENIRTQLEETLTTLNREHQYLKDQKKKHEKAHYGLEELFTMR